MGYFNQIMVKYAPFCSDPGFAGFGFRFFRFSNNQVAYRPAVG
jgi:hypothetical protein